MSILKIIRPILERSRKKTRPRQTDLYEVFCGVLYALKSGCQWRMLPKDYPKWATNHSYFQQWGELREDGLSLLQEALKKCGQEGKTKKRQERGDFSTYRGFAEH